MCQVPLVVGRELDHVTFNSQNPSKLASARKGCSPHGVCCTDEQLDPLSVSCERDAGRALGGFKADRQAFICDACELRAKATKQGQRASCLAAPWQNADAGHASSLRHRTKCEKYASCALSTVSSLELIG